MNKQELIEGISHLPSDCSRPRPMIDKLTALELIKLLDEPQKVTVPQFVADWIEECKNDDFHLFGAMEEMSLHQKKLDYWFREDTTWNSLLVLGLMATQSRKNQSTQLSVKLLNNTFLMMN